MPAPLSLQAASGRTATRRNAIALLVCAALLAGCHRAKPEGAATNLVVVKAMASGTVQRVLVNEGTDVQAGATILEIIVPAAASTANQNQAREQAQAAVSRAQRDLTDAETEVNRAAVEVQRVEPLVASGAAPQAQLDAARAQYQQAQERLQRVRDSAAEARSQAVAEQGREAGSRVAPAQTVVAVSAPAAGNLRVISVRAGQQVAAGQPIATISTGGR